MQDSEPQENILMAIAFAIDSTAHTTTKMTPGQLVFSNNIILHAEHAADWGCARLHKQGEIN